MTGRTHLGIGILACAVVQAAAPSALGLHNGFPFLPIALGSLLPDVDSTDSAVGRRVPGSQLGRFGRIAAGLLLIALGVARQSRTLGILPVAGVVVLASGLLAHRGFTHSLLGVAVAVLLARMVFPAGWQCVGLCYAAHVLSDALTPAGVPLLWPYEKRFGRGVVRTGTALYGVLHLAVWVLAAVAILKNGATFI